MIRIIGFDPATERSGYAVIDVIDGSPSLIECGVARAKGKTMESRLPEMLDDLGEIGARHVRELPEGSRVVFAIEKGYVSGKTLNNAIPMGAALAVAVLAAESCRSELPPGVEMVIVTVAPSQAKKAATGNGSAEKEQVRAGVAAMFDLGSSPPSDAADAIAVALAGRFA